jgi:hypothetical protein
MSGPLLECLLSGRHPVALYVPLPWPVSFSFSIFIVLMFRYRVHRNLVLLNNLFEALRRKGSRAVSAATSTDSNTDLQDKLEDLKIVVRKEVPVHTTSAVVAPPQKKHLSKKQRSALERRAARLAREEPMRVRAVHAVYVPGTSFSLLREFPLLGAIIDAFVESVVHKGGPCALLIRKAIFVAPPRFGLSVRALEHAFDTLSDVAKPIYGTDAADSPKHDTASIRLNASGTVMSGRATRVTVRLMKTLRAFDEFGTHCLRIIAGVLSRWSLFGFAESVNAVNLLEAIKYHFDHPKVVEEKKHVLSVFYKPEGVIEGHVDTVELATFITTRTPNDDRETLLNLANMESKELKHTVAYHRWDLVFFPANVWHQTSAYPEAREIMNLFY